MNPDLVQQFAAAARLIDMADSIIIAAGAGMGVDSGLPDFRGPAGFWQAYPALGRARLRFEEVASPRRFREDPRLAWGFYGHRLALYRATIPHEGFRILHEWCASMPLGGFVFTSNVDGQFQRAGFAQERIVECHGSIHHLQCVDRCSEAIWSADDFLPDVDEEKCRIVGEMPRCPSCGALARPAILMFGDWDWLEGRTQAQLGRFAAWRARVARPLVIELGAGGAIPTVRHFSESQDCPVIRINPTEFGVPRRTDIGIPGGALAALAGIGAALSAGAEDTLR